MTGMTMMQARSSLMIRPAAAAGLAALLAATLAACSADPGTTSGNGGGGAGGGGTADISIGGEPYTVTSVSCREVGGSNFHQVLANGEGHGFVQVRFGRVDPYSDYNFDEGSIRYSNDPGLLESRTTGSITGSERHAVGWAEVHDNPYAREERRSEPLRIEVDIRCD